MTNNGKENERPKVCNRMEHQATPGREANFDHLFHKVMNDQTFSITREFIFDRYFLK